jgi:hypothetical protein
VWAQPAGYCLARLASGHVAILHANDMAEATGEGAAKERKGMQFTALLHHLTVGPLREGLFAPKRKAAPGVDGVTWEEYESGLEGRLVDLHSRVYRGAYRAQPSRLFMS